LKAQLAVVVLFCVVLGGLPSKLAAVVLSPSWWGLCRNCYRITNE